MSGSSQEPRGAIAKHDFNERHLSLLVATVAVIDNDALLLDTTSGF